MISKEDLEAFYSPYGYLQVSKADYDSSSALIKFYKKGSITGSINVISKSITKIEKTTH